MKHWEKDRHRIYTSSVFIVQVCAFIMSHATVVFHDTTTCTFLQEIYELGSSEQGEVHVENGGQGSASASEQSPMEINDGETDNTKVYAPASKILI